MKKILSLALFLALSLAYSQPGFAQSTIKVCVPVSSTGATEKGCQDVTSGNPLPVTASVSVGGFAPGGQYATPLSVTNSSGNVALPSPGATVVVYNPGANGAYVKLGTSNAITATTSDDYIPAGGALAFSVGSNTYLAAITASNTTTLNLSAGTGLFSGFGGGSSGGGGAVTNAGIFLVQLNATPTLANGNGVVPTQGGAVLSATNGFYSNYLQGNAVLSATNGIFSNLLQANAVLSASNGLFSNLVIAGAADSATNGLYFNLLQGNAVNAAGNPIFVTAAQATAANLNATVVQSTAANLNMTEANSAAIKTAVQSAIPTQVPTVSIGGVGIIDSAGTNVATVKAASTASVAADKSLVVQLNPGNAANTVPYIANTSTQYPSGAVAITASATGTTGATTATLAGTSGKTTYICSYSIRANATAATTVTDTITGTITGTLSSILWVAPLASGLGVDEGIFAPCVPASATNTGIAVVSGAPGSGGTVSSHATGYQL